ncbi:MAG: insulinase family protein [Bacilli bacterium]|nr:insulinase family protein [Bacilli bacterium]
MQIKDIKKINNNTYYYYDDSGVDFVINNTFVFDTSRINSLKAEILSDYLTTINKKYDSVKKVYNKKRELFSPVLSMFSMSYSNKSLFTINYRMIDPKIVKEDYFDDSLEFLHDMIFNPLFIDGKLDSDRVSIIKKDIYDRFINTVKDFYYEVNTKFDKTVLKGYSNNLLIYDTKEELKKELDSITDKDIIDFYNEIINNHYKTLLFGKINKEQINKVLKTIKLKGTNNSKIEKREYIDLQSEYNEYISKEYTQSVLHITYNIKNVDKYTTRPYITVLNTFINGLEGLLYQTLRYKYGLVYNCGGYMLFRKSNVIVFDASIDKKNKDKTIEAIKEVIEGYKDIKKVEERLDITKKKIKQNAYLADEFSYNIFDKVYNYLYNEGLSDKKYIEMINKITAKDIVEFFSSLDKENIFFYVGDKDE